MTVASLSFCRFATLSFAG